MADLLEGLGFGGLGFGRKCGGWIISPGTFTWNLSLDLFHLKLETFT